MQYSIKEAAEFMGVTAHTLRYYEKEGILPYIQRDDYGNRVFHENNIEWMGFIKCLRETGMSIKELKHFADLNLSGEHTIPLRKEILYKHRLLMEKKLEETQKYLERINGKITYYESLNDYNILKPSEEITTK
jgi:DNA-binding transcriptional MerR regulator